MATYAEVREFDKNNREKANELVKTYRARQDNEPLTPELELGRDIIDVRQHESYIEEAQKGEEKSMPHSGLSGFLIGMSFIPFGFRKDSTEIMENDYSYESLKQQKLNDFRKEWEKNNPGKDFNQSQERLDFTYGSLDDDDSPSLRKQTEEAFRKDHQKKAKRYDEKIKNTKKNPNEDRAISFLKRRVEREIEFRKALFAKENPDTAVKNFKKEGEKIEERVKQKRWEEFVKKHPEKAKTYAGEKYKKTEAHREINAAIQRISAPKITGDRGLDDQLREYYKKEWKEREVPKEEKKESQGFGEVPKIGDEKLDDELRSFYSKTPSKEQVREPIKKQQPASPSSRFQGPRPERVHVPRLKNLRLPGRGGMVDKVNRFARRVKAGKRAVKMATNRAKQLAKTALKTIAKEPHVRLVLIIIAAFVLIAIAFIFFFSPQGPSGTTPPPTPGPQPIPSGLPIPGFEKPVKSGPERVRNNELIRYDIIATYSGDLDIWIVDPIPKDSSFVEASGKFEKEIEFESKEVTAIKWRLKDNTTPESSNSNTFLFNLWIKPYNPDLSFYEVANQAYAVAGDNSPPQEGNIEPSINTCEKYNLSKNPIGKNYGDPICDYTKDKLYEILKQKDPQYADDWYFNIVRCESSYNPNEFASHEAIGTPDAAGAWGLFQMGRGKNGEYDHGDVYWNLQISNAINYNNIKLNKNFRYWACARYLWR